jgi:mannitol/fructose-specific phosphotransferase system IIA component (Ntr-type)
VVGAIGRSRKGIQFDALDGKPVNLVMLFLMPQGQFQKHLHTLANLASSSVNRIPAMGCDAIFSACR